MAAATGLNGCVCETNLAKSMTKWVELWGCGGLREAQPNAKWELHALTPAAQDPSAAASAWL